MTKRQPQAFRPDDPKLQIETIDDGQDDIRFAPDSDLEFADLQNSPPVRQEGKAPANRGIGWWSLLFTALGGLISLAAGIWITDLINGLFARNDWIGYGAICLVVVALISAFMIFVREFIGVWRLQRITSLREAAEQVLLDGSLNDARKLLKGLKSLYAPRKDLAWGFARLKAHERDEVDAKDLATLAERELLVELDAQAKGLVAQSARRISVVTAISPLALVDVVYVAIENMKLLHRIATLYGGRPGAMGVLKLARMVLTHLTLTGGIALSSDFIQQLVGQKITAKLSARLGEGIFNGALAARIGIAAIEICRPLPFIEAKPPRFRDFLFELTRSNSKQDK